MTPRCKRGANQDGECWLCPDCKKKLDDRIERLEEFLDKRVPGWRDVLDPKKKCPDCGADMEPVEKAMAVVLRTHGIHDAWRCPQCGAQPFFGPVKAQYLEP